MLYSDTSQATFVDRATEKVREIPRLFYVFVAVPTLLAILYFGFIATDVYISESRFVVRSADKPQQSGLAGILTGQSTVGGSREAAAVRDYVESRDALQALNGQHAVEKMFSRSNIDPFSRFGWMGDRSFEALFRYFKKRVDVSEDSSTAITRLIVRAYSPADAAALNERLLRQSEALVNRMNERARLDLIRYADNETRAAQERAKRAALALSEFRNRRGVIDPEKQAAVSTQMISKLQDELISSQTQLVTLRSLAPDNPQIAALKLRIDSLQKEIDDQIRRIAGSRGSLADTAAQYQSLTLESELGDRLLTSALASLEAARNEARRQQVYVERIVQPNLPDEPLEPKRWRGILTTLIVGLLAWGITTMFSAAVKEHKD